MESAGENAAGGGSGVACHCLRLTLANWLPLPDFSRVIYCEVRPLVNTNLWFLQTVWLRVSSCDLTWCG